MPSIEHASALLLLPLALLPVFRRNQKKLPYSWVGMIPEDPVSRKLDIALRLTAALSMLALVLGLAGPYSGERMVERIGSGAHIVLLLDRSSSMNDNFSGRYMDGDSAESKSAVARRLLLQFVKRREEDLFAMISFSTSPIYVLPLTRDKAAVQAAIRGAAVRGRGVTDMGAGLGMALDYFVDQPVTGARVILLVSDGAARIEAKTRELLRQRFARENVILYWIYLRTRGSGSLHQAPANPSEDTTPEVFLHRYFQSMETPYKAYEADNPEALQQAITDFGRLENKPIRYLEKLPRRDLSQICYTAAMLGLLLLLGAKASEVRTWGR